MILQQSARIITGVILTRTVKHYNVLVCSDIGVRRRSLRRLLSHGPVLSGTISARGGHLSLYGSFRFHVRRIVICSH